MEKNASSSSGLPRRDFIKKAATAAAAVAAAPLFKATVYGQAPSVGVAGANNRITVGVIGVGFGIGKDHLQGIHKNCNANNTVVAAACDVYKTRREAAQQVAGLKDADVVLEYQKLLERKDIDAVLIATHDPMHAQITIDAVQAGKHVYCEKPLTRYLGEAFKVYDAVKASGKVFQIGSQGCSATGWQKCAELIKSGKLGQLVWAQGFYCRNNAGGEWNYAIDTTSTAENIDWKRWLGPVKDRPFSAEDFHRWRKYYRYCGGLFSDLVPHRLLPLMLATGNPEFPKRVVAMGTHAVHEDKENKDKSTPEREVQEHIQLLAEFPSGPMITVTSSSIAEKSPGFTLYCHKASLNVGTSGEKIEIVPEKQFSEEIDPETMKEGFQAEDIRMHEKNWFDCIRSGKTTNGHIELAVRAQTVISLAEMADRLQTVCLFDDKTRKVTDGSGKELKPLTYEA
jgi:predicted dehydrogenase